MERCTIDYCKYVVIGCWDDLLESSRFDLFFFFPFLLIYCFLYSSMFLLNGSFRFLSIHLSIHISIYWSPLFWSQCHNFLLFIDLQRSLLILAVFLFVLILFLFFMLLNLFIRNAELLILCIIIGNLNCCQRLRTHRCTNCLHRRLSQNRIPPYWIWMTCLRRKRNRKT